MSAADASREIAGSLREFDFNRSACGAARRGRFKQWTHTTIIGPEIALMANFSSVYRRDPAGQQQIAILVFGSEVRGTVRRVDRALCHIPVGHGSLRFDRSGVVLDGSEYRLELDEPNLDLRARLVLRATAQASMLQNVSVAGGGLFHWAVVPRLLAYGTVDFEGRSYTLEEAPAYRDRNWGTFAFGDLAWDWGYAVAPGEGGAHAVVFARLMDQTRNRVLEQAVMVWQDPELLATFRNREVTFRRSGTAPPPGLTIPAALRLCCPSRASDVPATIAVNGASSRGSIEIVFRAERTARIVVPNDGRPGVTSVHEVVGGVEVEGNVEGHVVRFEGHGFVECVHG